MDFGALTGGAKGAKTFWGLSGVYKVTTQKEKNWHPKKKIDTQGLCDFGYETLSRFVQIFLWKLDFLANISFLEGPSWL